jgi:hypothetical protein
VDEAWLDTVRIARDCGDISSLFPEGITRLWDLPYTIFNAIKFALSVLTWRENLKAEEIPPKHIWLDNDRMEAWWREVKANREAEAKGHGDLQSMPQNALIKRIFGRSAG